MRDMNINPYTPLMRRVVTCDTDLSGTPVFSFRMNIFIKEHIAKSLLLQLRMIPWFILVRKVWHCRKKRDGPLQDHPFLPSKTCILMGRFSP